MTKDQKSALLEAFEVTPWAVCKTLLEINERLAEALDYVQYVHIEKIEKLIKGDEIHSWALEHNRDYAQDALAFSQSELAKLLGKGVE